MSVSGWYFDKISIIWAHGVVVSNPLSMREALGSILSVSMLICKCLWHVYIEASLEKKPEKMHVTGGFGNYCLITMCSGCLILAHRESPANPTIPRLIFLMYRARYSDHSINAERLFQKKRD